MKTLFRALGRFFALLRTLLSNLMLLLALIMIASLLLRDHGPKVPDKAALVLNLDGALVEEVKSFDPSAALGKALRGDEEPPELLLSDVVRAIDAASSDPRIQALVIDSQNLLPAGIDKLMTIGNAINNFKQSGKPVYAIGDYYLQHQYLLASYADTVFMHPNGGVTLTGLGSYPLYMKAFLDKLLITPHVYRVGTYKAAVEPYLRNDMSPAAKEANLALLADLWAVMRDQIATNRKLQPEVLDLDIAKVASALSGQQGDMAKLALELGLVDELQQREAVREQLITLVGRDPEHNSFSQIWLSAYQAALPAQPVTSGNKVGIVVAQGVIMDGDQPQGSVGGDSTAWLLRQARFDDSIKAVVLRIDSPGGSAFASDLIRAEVDELKKAGKPVVASMGSLAASGGYWIAAAADEIWAAPTTITGSIGIFGLITTIDRAMNHWGLNSDGVATSDLAGALSITRPIAPEVGHIIQQSIDHGYRQFLELVARERGMEIAAVDKVAQGRVWSGRQAQGLGLVDQLGGLDDAVAAAARLAQLEHYQRETVSPPLNLRDQLLRDLFDQAASYLPATTAPSLPPQLAAFSQQLQQQLAQMAQWNDPNHSYALCVDCPQP